MKVKFIPSKEVPADSWLDEDVIYTVLCVYAGKDGVLYRLSASDDTMSPVFHSAKILTILDHRIPSTWTVHAEVGRSGSMFLEICPAAWMADGFWERYFDNDDEARKIFERERKKIMSEESSDSPTVN